MEEISLPKHCVNMIVATIRLAFLMVDDNRHCKELGNLMIISYIEELSDVNCGSENILKSCIAVPSLQMTQVPL